MYVYVIKVCVYVIEVCVYVLEVCVYVVTHLATYVTCSAHGTCSVKIVGAEMYIVLGLYRICL